MPRTSISFVTSFSEYTSSALIGEGGSGRVYKATDLDGQKWAIKVLDPSKTSRDKLKRFKNEIAFCRKAEHPHIVSVTDNGVVTISGKACPFFVMPLFDGSLRDLLKAKIPDPKVLQYFSQILDGVEAAHLQKAIHRDLKPENILYDKASDRLVVADFGIAQFEAEALYTSIETAPNTRLANFQYAAPEQRNRNQNLSIAADIYALGLILNEMFTGEIPYGTSFKTVAAVVSEFAYIDDLIANMLRQDSAERPKTIDLVKSDLIARGNAFIEKQKLDLLKAKVVPVSQISDSLIENPPTVTDAKWNDGMLTVWLSQPVNETWNQCLYHFGNYTSIWGLEPGHFKFSRNSATVRIDHNQAQQAIDHFKEWLPRVNSVYAQKIESDRRQAEEQERIRLRNEIEAAELRAKVNRELRV